MKKSDYNKALLENFVLWYTHFNREEAIKGGGVATALATGLYEQIDLYIENDHVDGVDGDDEQIREDFYGK